MNHVLLRVPLPKLGRLGRAIHCTDSADAVRSDDFIRSPSRQRHLVEQFYFTKLGDPCREFAPGKRPPNLPDHLNQRHSLPRQCETDLNLPGLAPEPSRRLEQL